MGPQGPDAEQCVIPATALHPFGRWADSIERLPMPFLVSGQDRFEPARIDVVPSDFRQIFPRCAVVNDEVAGHRGQCFEVDRHGAEELCVAAGVRVGRVAGVVHH